MTVVCTFNSVTVPTRHVVSEKMVGTAGAYGYEVELECATKDRTQYTALAALFGHTGQDLLLSGHTAVTSPLGTKASLVLNGTTYTNCYIADLSNMEADGTQLGLWIFNIRFVRDTS